MPVEMPVPKSPLKYAGTKRISGCVSAGAGQDKKSARGTARTAAPLARPKGVVTQRAVRLSVGRRGRVVGNLRPLRALRWLRPLGTFRSVGSVRPIRPVDPGGAIGGDAIGPLPGQQAVEVLQRDGPVLLDVRQRRLQGRLRLVGSLADHVLENRDTLVKNGGHRQSRPRQSGGLRLTVLSGALGHGVGIGLPRLLFVAAAGGGMFLQRGDRL